MIGMDTLEWAALDKVAVTVTVPPACTGFGDTDREAVRFGRFRMVTSTEFGLPAVIPLGREPPSATVNVSLLVSASSVVVIVPVPLVAPFAILIEDRLP